MAFTVVSHRSKVTRRGFVAAITVTTSLSVGLATSSTSATAVRPSASSAANPGTLTQQWLAALGPGVQAFPKIEHELKVLPVTATDAQVERIVAPVAGLVEPVVALLSPPNAETASLESLGMPSEGIGVPAPEQPCGGDRRGYGYNSVGKGAHLQMAGRIYLQGFQITTNGNCGGTYAWGWHVGHSYRTFTALVGLDFKQFHVCASRLRGARRSSPHIRCRRAVRHHGDPYSRGAHQYHRRPR